VPRQAGAAPQVRVDYGQGPARVDCVWQPLPQGLTEQGLID